ncbi:MAG: hypothetical protein O3A46_05810 [Candidatus Poribacteria bacterium]|nr:hypothetical protein [Candidatus Poribacteria bacterium]
MRPMREYPVLQFLLKPYHTSHQKTLAWLIAALAEAGEARTRSIGAVLSERQGIRLGSTCHRQHRLMKNPRLDD